MKTKKINIEEFNFKVNDSRNMLVKLIDNQINNYKLQYLTDWERNHSISPDIKNEKIKALEEKKASLNALLNECDKSNNVVDFKISIDLSVKNNLSIAV